MSLYVDPPLSFMLYFVDYAHELILFHNESSFKWKRTKLIVLFNHSLLLRQDLFFYCDPL